MRSVEITITSDDPDQSVSTFEVGGYGLKPLLSGYEPESRSFGKEVRISGTKAIVATEDGAHIFYQDQGGEENWGHANANRTYIFYHHEGGTDNWGPKFIDSIFGRTLTQFGDAVALKGTTLAMGGPLVEIDGPSKYGQGYVRVFYRSGGEGDKTR